MQMIEIDFEFNSSQNPTPNLVCCSVTDRAAGWVKSFWLYESPEEWQTLVTFLRQYQHTHIFLSYAVIAEARSMLTLGIEDVASGFKWIDLYVEWRALTNHNHHMQYGNQLIDGKVVRTFPPKPKYEQTAEDKKRNNSSAQHSMAAAAYKLLGAKVDTEHKDRIRDIIISNDRELIIENKDKIIAYCESDLTYLRPMLTAMTKEYKRLLRPDDYARLKEDMLWRGEYAARTAIIEQLGYPIDYQSTKNFADSVPAILRDIQAEINELFPEIEPFRYNKRTTKTHNANTFSWNQKRTKEWVRTLDPQIVEGWVKTAKGDLSLSLDAFTKYFSFRHDFPKDNFGAQIVRYLKAKQQLNGFMPSKAGKRNFWDSLGGDHRSRPFLGIYGSQSSRNQPSSTGFLFLKSAWMRALCVPPKGRAICAIDFGSEEFLIAGLESGDQRMIEAYHTGDPYLYFGKAAGAIPPEGTKKTHAFLRDKFKSTTLGIQYLMGAKSLALKLTADTGVHHTEEEAQELIDLFGEVFSVYDQYREDIVEEYYHGGYIMLDDGWPMFGDNDNFRSIANCPVQGMGGVVLRKMVKKAQEADLDLVLTLHDAGYIEFDAEDLAAVDTFFEVMAESFSECYEDTDYHKFSNIRLDGNIWGPDLDGVGSVTTPRGRILKAEGIYVDERAVNEYSAFSKYFENNHEELEELL